MLKVLSNLLNTNERELKRLAPLVEKVNRLSGEMNEASDEQLAAYTPRLRSRLEQGESLEAMLAEAFAVVREVAHRTLGERPFDVQVMGGIVLHQGNIAEMKTGEGKTLAATMPAYLNALTGKGVHIVTVNDYLARRDSEWMGQVYRFLGLTVGVIHHGQEPEERKEAYSCDIIYATNNELGFDYLRDNMVHHSDHMVQRDLHYAIIDEVDSILVDEARTPLIISGSTERSTDLYRRFAQLVRNFKPEVDYTVDEKARTVEPTDGAIEKTERMLGIANLFDDPDMVLLNNCLRNAIRAKALMRRDVDYVVKGGDVIIVDQFTGRLMPGRRYSDGLHQAMEAKEGVHIQKESQTLATITFQNFFRMYDKLAGMTGTAVTEEEEFSKIYKLDVVVVPTHKPMIREDEPDVVYRTQDAKFRFVIDDIVASHEKGQPVLVGTVSIENSEHLSRLLARRGVDHEVLNAKHHEKEARIIAQAGRLGAVTIATNMAGRGTDIVLGGNPAYRARERLLQKGYEPEVVAMATDKFASDAEEVLAARQEYEEFLEESRKAMGKEHEQVICAGGLRVIGTERHDSRRIDNQLRGRSGRQGDPGSSRFCLSLEDDLMRLFGSDAIAGVMDRIGMEDDEPIEHALISRAIERAQRRVEARNFEMRKNVLEYDDVMNRQREVIYEQRRRVLQGADLEEQIENWVDKVVEDAVSAHTPADIHPEEWNLESLIEHVNGSFLPGQELCSESLSGMERPQLVEYFQERAQAFYQERKEVIGEDIMRALLLRVVDQHWMNHLAAMDDLREGIGLRAYGQRNPLLQYQAEAFEFFNTMTEEIQRDAVTLLFRVEMRPDNQRMQRRATSPPPRARPAQPAQRVTTVRKGQKIGRNQPCPCGSGKKYKKCCGRSA